MINNASVQELHENSIKLESSQDYRGAIQCLTQLSALLPDNASILNKLSILCFRLDDLHQAVAYCNKAISLTPDSSSFHNTLALILREKGDFDAAIESLKSALHLDKSNAQAWNNLGTIYKEQADLIESEHCFKNAIQINPSFTQALTNLGSVYKLMSNPALASQFHRKAIEADPNNLDAQFNLANSQNEEGHTDAAYHSFQQVIHHSPQHIGALLGQSLIELARGEFELGFEKFEHRFRHPLKLQPSLPNNIAYWQGEDLTNKTLLITWEQGLGDQIQFIRYVKFIDNPKATILVQTPSALHQLFSTIPMISVITPDEIPTTVDFFCPVMSLPRLFRTSFENIPQSTPYFTIPDNVGRSWEKKLIQRTAPNTRRVGLVWQGDPHNQTDYKRSLPFELLQPILECDGFTFFSLQFGEGHGEQWEKTTGKSETHLASEINDFIDTAAILQNLDLLISVDTSIIHLAGALNLPVWSLISFISDWRWAGKDEVDNTPWYPTMRLYRQPALNDWRAVIRRIKADLIEIIR